MVFLPLWLLRRGRLLLLDKGLYCNRHLEEQRRNDERRWLLLQ